MLIVAFAAMVLGVLLIVLPRSVFQLEGIGYVWPARALAFAMGGMFFLYGVALVIVLTLRQ